MSFNSTKFFSQCFLKRESLGNNSNSRAASNLTKRTWSAPAFYPPSHSACLFPTRTSYSKPVIRQIFENFFYPSVSNFTQAFLAQFFHFLNELTSIAVDGRLPYAVNRNVSLHCTNHFPEFQIFAQTHGGLRDVRSSKMWHNTDVIFVYESWLNNVIDSGFIDIECFLVLCFNRPKSKNRN